MGMDQGKKGCVASLSNLDILFFPRTICAVSQSPELPEKVLHMSQDRKGVRRLSHWNMTDWQLVIGAVMGFFLFYCLCGIALNVSLACLGCARVAVLQLSLGSHALSARTLSHFRVRRCAFYCRTALIRCVAIATTTETWCYSCHSGCWNH